MLKVIKIETVYPATEDDEEDYDPEGDSSSETIEVSFRELVDLMREHCLPSSSPASGSVWEWISTELQQDYRTGEFTGSSIHYDRENPARNSKYWKAAMRAAGIMSR
jgi:hypothetical protein